MIKSIIVVLGSPPAKTPLVAFDAVPTVPLASVKSPKFCALPVVEMLTYDMLLIFEPVLPPAAIPRIGDPQIPSVCASAE